MISTDLVTPLAATIVEVTASEGMVVHRDQVVAIVEAMKMEHEVRSHLDGLVAEVFIAVGDVVDEGAALMRVVERAALQVASAPDPTDALDEPAQSPSLVETAFADEAGPAPAPAPAPPATAPATTLRAPLAEALRRHAFTLDAARPDAVAKRHRLGLRTARENVADLCDAGSFVEYGALAVAAQSQRRDADDLMKNTPADGIVTGIGTINAGLFVEGAAGMVDARCVVMAYDATVLAGTQGHRNHQKTDRMLGLAASERLPVVLFAEGGGGRPGDVDLPIVAGLHVPTFTSYARLSGVVPTIAIVAGRCFAGNAALAASSDVVIATRGSNIGMGGPAMIEGGGLGTFRPDEVGPAAVHATNGVVDVLCDDEAGAVRVARRWLGYFQGRTATWRAHDQARLRDALPDNRVRAYDVRPIVETLFDADSTIESKPGYGAAVLTCLARIEGRPVGVLASQSAHNGGAIDGDAADKATAFVDLCNRFDLPLVSLIDTPGFMVGPDVEAQGHARRCGRLFIAAAKCRAGLVAVVLRKAYGLGAMALTGGGFHAASGIVSWPTGEFGAMGLEGAVRLGYRKELDAVPEGAERDALFERLVAGYYARGGALNMAATLEIDAVIDPADTRDWIARRLPAAIARR